MKRDFIFQTILIILLVSVIGLLIYNAFVWKEQGTQCYKDPVNFIKQNIYENQKKVCTVNIVCTNDNKDIGLINISLPDN